MGLVLDVHGEWSGSSIISCAACNHRVEAGTSRAQLGGSEAADGDQKFRECGFPVGLKPVWVMGLVAPRLPVRVSAE